MPMDNPQTSQPQSDEKLLTLERDIQNLRLELTERNQTIDKLKQQLEQQRTSENNNIDSAVQNQIEQLLTDTAVPCHPTTHPSTSFRTR